MSAEYTLQEQIAAASREINMRERVYPNLVRTKRMTQEAASYELGAMRAILRTLQKVQADQK